jgi:hypothetical protein
MRNGLFLVPAMMAFAIAGPADAGLMIDPTFDPTIKSDPNAASIETTIESAIAVFETLFSNPITVPIYFQEGGGLGQSNVFVYRESYSSFYTGLLTNGANPTAIADLTANGGAGVDNPVTGNTFIQLKSANARAVGIDIPAGCQLMGSAGSYNCGGSSGPAYDGIISLNTAITYPPQANNGSNYELLATAEHEIDEVLGLGSALTNCDPSDPTASAVCQAGSVLNAMNDTPFNAPAPEDLWRFAANGTTRVLSTNCASPTNAFLFLNAMTEVAQFNNACNGGDFGDWQSSPLPNGVSAQVQDAFADPGENTSLGPSEIAALTAIGYDLSETPEPSTWALLASSLAALALLNRRRTPNA